MQLQLKNELNHIIDLCEEKLENLTPFDVVKELELLKVISSGDYAKLVVIINFSMVLPEILHSNSIEIVKAALLVVNGEQVVGNANGNVWVNSGEI